MIFRIGDITYYCTIYESFFAEDAITEKNVGEATLEGDWLSYIFAEPEYRGQGIATNLLKAMVKTLKDNFLIPVRGRVGEHSYYLTKAGAGLINNCIAKGVINDEQCMVDVPLATRSPTPF